METAPKWYHTLIIWELLNQLKVGFIFSILLRPPSLCILSICQTTDFTHLMIEWAVRYAALNSQICVYLKQCNSTQEWTIKMRMMYGCYKNEGGWMICHFCFLPLCYHVIVEKIISYWLYFWVKIENRILWCWQK